MTPRTSLKTVAVTFAVIAAVFCVAGWLVLCEFQQSSKEVLAEARLALDQKDYAAALEAAGSIAEGTPESVSGKLIAAEALIRLGDTDRAAAVLQSVPRDSSKDSVIAAFTLAEVQRDSGRLQDALHAYQYVLEQSPDYELVHQRLALLYGLSGQRWKSRPHFMALLQAGQMPLQELAILGDLQRPLEFRELLEKFQAMNPDDPLVLLGLGAAAFSEGRPLDAKKFLDACLEVDSSLVTAHGLLGELLVDGHRSSFTEWNSRLPEGANDLPQIWLVRGLWAKALGDLKAAARCFQEALRRSPENRRANYQMSLVLNALSHDATELFSVRAARLSELTRLLDDALRSEGRNERAVQQIVGVLEQVGRYWEAWAWCRAAGSLFPQSQWPRHSYTRLSKLVVADASQTVDGRNPALTLDLSEFPSYVTLLSSHPDDKQKRRLTATAAQIRFRDATDVGLEFVYDNDGDLDTPGARMFEQTGGGLAVLDFDQDAWPDMFFTQGGRFVAPDGREHETRRTSDAADHLYRNRNGERLEEVSTLARIEDFGFGQGVSTGDVNNDGFPDLYVANIGRNQLHINNGDGTFSESTEDYGVSAREWTTSCLIADLNVDGNPELFDVNYVTGENVYSLICNGRACSPKTFDGVPDRLLLSGGDGTISSQQTIVSAGQSKGLGLVAASIVNRGRLDLFVANDQVPNSLLRNEPGDEPGQVAFKDEAFLAGLAYNDEGLAMACMGIAADDANADGQLDFFVTNFKDEFNTLYLQDLSGAFVDATSRAGLGAAGFPYVGWGTQFLDADLDGSPDLVVVNGHVDDYRDEGGEYQMPSHFFHQTEQGRFRLMPANEVGSWFGQPRLGRSLTRLDWNRDGRPEFAVSCIGERASLLENITEDCGRFLSIQLTAVSTARDALGAEVTVQAANARRVKQLTAGDGYQASNERLLRFGLGAEIDIVDVTIAWPSGMTQSLKAIPANAMLELVEGRQDGTLWLGVPPRPSVVSWNSAGETISSGRDR